MNAPQRRKGFLFPMGQKDKLLILCKTYYQPANARLVKCFEKHGVLTQT